ncbi:hypothetical protein BH11BAC7_BH11BAC7_29010 [soil metagenome]
MMNTHIINKQVIELKVFSEENAFGLQQDARAAYMTNVLPLISDVLDEFAGPDEVLRIDKIELDFGILNAAKMGEQMKERIREALLKQLPGFKRSTNASGKQHFTLSENALTGKKNTAQLMSGSFSQRELLTIYFETGFLPWWATDETEALDIDELIIELFEKEPVTTMQWLQHLAIRSPIARKRIMLQLDKSTQKFILATIPAKIISSLQSLSKQLQAVAGNSNAFSFQPEPAEELFYYVLLVPENILHSTTNTTKELTGSLIRQLAIISQTVYADFEKQLYAHTLSEVLSSGNKAATAPDLVDYFVSWEKENSEAAASVTGNSFCVLEIFTGKDERSIGELADEIELALIAFEESQPVERRFSKHFSKRKKQTRVLLKNKRKFISNTSREIAEGSLIAKADVQSDLILSATDLGNKEDSVEAINENDHIDAVKINWFKAKDEKSVPEKISGKIEALPEKKSSEADVIGKELAEQIILTGEKKPVNERAGEMQKNDAEEKSLADKSPVEVAAPISADEIDNSELAEGLLLQKKPSAGMTRFGGLVILAPFLPAFFSELKLVENGKFTSEANQFKAVHLLNFLATGKTSSPEYKLLLHKLLCGIEITQPIPKSIKLTVAEKKEAMLFLDDIAGQWATLRSTSGKAFRDTFFRRNGILEKRDNSWLLRVERAPMDIMLDTLPWTISIIKSSWMQQLLQVEW